MYYVETKADNSGYTNLTPLSTIFQLYHGGQFLLVGETGVPRENHWPATSQWQALSHNVVLSTPCHERNSNPQRFIWRRTSGTLESSHLFLFYYGSERMIINVT
jgi:hypothetical protein